VIKQYGNTKRTTIHVTESSSFKFNELDELNLVSNPELAKGYRKEIDALNFYRSLPTKDKFVKVKGYEKGVIVKNLGKLPEDYVVATPDYIGKFMNIKGYNKNLAKPQAYLAYLGDVNPLDYYHSSSKLSFSLLPTKKRLIIENLDVKYFKPKRGESPLSYNERVLQKSGITMLPAENLFSKSIEKQTVTPSAFTGKRGVKYVGSKLKKVKDLGFTYYEQKYQLPLGLNKFSKLQKLYEGSGLGKEYIKLHLTKVKTLPLTDIQFNKLSKLKGSNIVSAEKYKSSYVDTKKLSSKDILKNINLSRSSISSKSIKSLSSISKSLSSLSSSVSPSKSYSSSKSKSLELS